jgi:hypothetical protein
MKNITLAVDDRVLAAVRRYAVERETSVNGLVREFLNNLATQHDRSRNARIRIRELSRRSPARIGRKSWDRESLHDR